MKKLGKNFAKFEIPRDDTRELNTTCIYKGRKCYIYEFKNDLTVVGLMTNNQNDFIDESIRSN